MAYEIDGIIAEELVDPSFRNALNEAFDASPELYQEQKKLAEELICMMANRHREGKERAWDTQREAALSSLRGDDLGPFNKHFQRKSGTSEPAELTIIDLGPGDPNKVRTNTRITSLEKSYDEPLDFLQEALSIIQTRERQNADNVGPENYATTIKYFADKYRDFPSRHLDPTLTKELADKTLSGFFAVAENDKPNFVEMTNVYYAIRQLPTGIVSEQFTKPLLLHTLEQLPDYNSATLSLVLSVIGKINVSNHGEAAASVVDLTLRKNNSFATTTDMAVALRAISNLPPSDESERAFYSFLKVRNDVERALDVSGAETVSAQLLYITKNVIRHAVLSQHARELSRSVLQQSMNAYRHSEYLGDVTKLQLQQMKTSVERISSNFQKM